MFAHTVIEGSGGSREVVIVPETSVFDYQGGKVVFISAGPNRYQARSVEIGGSTGEGIEILAGLQAGEEVVATGGLPLKSLLMNQRSK